MGAGVVTEASGGVGKERETNNHSEPSRNEVLLFCFTLFLQFFFVCCKVWSFEPEQWALRAETGALIFDYRA